MVPACLDAHLHIGFTDPLPLRIGPFWRVPRIRLTSREDRLPTLGILELLPDAHSSLQVIAVYRQSATYPMMRRARDFEGPQEVSHSKPFRVRNSRLLGQQRALTLPPYA